MQHIGTRNEPSILRLIIIVVVSIAVVIYAIISFATGDFLWFSTTFRETPNAIVLHCYGETMNIDPGSFHFSKFKEIMNDYSATKYIYVADNPAKDFIAANDLGWLTIGLHGDTQNIHSQELEGVPEDHHPKHWINDLSELMD